MALQEEFEKQGNILFKYRGILPIIILIVGLAVFSYSKYNNQYPEDNFISENIAFIAIGISFIGLIIRAYTVGHTPKNTSGRNTEDQLADTINKTGIYSTVRHPLYVGNFFMWLGISALTLNIWFIISFVFFYWVYYERIMFAEEQFLRKKFGDMYLSWATITPAFVPCLKKWKKPALSFSWKKVIQKEKNGFLAIFVVVYLFKTIEVYIEKQEFIVEDMWLIYATIFAIAYYIIVKYTNKWTSLLKHDR